MMRKSVLGLALFVSVCASARPAPIYGDVNGSGGLDFNDAVILCRVAGGLTAATSTIYRNGDVAPVNDYQGGSFGDGRISLPDALRVARKVGGLSTPLWPAASSGWLLEAGNVMVTRQYDATGAAITGPGTAEADVSTVFTGPFSETVGSKTYNDVYYATSSDGDVQHFVQIRDTGGTPVEVLATQLTLEGNPAKCEPPLIALRYPLANGTKWNGTTTATDVASGTAVTATYNGSITGPFTVTMADGVHTFDNAYKVTISYSAGLLLNGAEYYWFVPFVGPVQHGYTRTALFTTTAVNPDYRLVSGNVHGVLYP